MRFIAATARPSGRPGAPRPGLRVADLEEEMDEPRSGKTRQWIRRSRSIDDEEVQITKGKIETLGRQQQ